MRMTDLGYNESNINLQDEYAKLPPQDSPMTAAARARKASGKTRMSQKNVHGGDTQPTAVILASIPDHDYLPSSKIINAPEGSTTVFERAREKESLVKATTVPKGRPPSPKRQRRDPSPPWQPSSSSSSTWNANWWSHQWDSRAWLSSRNAPWTYTHGGYPR